MKKLNFVFDKKSGDMLAPHFVPNHVVAIREYQTMDSKGAIFEKFPGDFILVTCQLDFDYGDLREPRGFRIVSHESTEFMDIIGDVNAG